MSTLSAENAKDPGPVVVHGLVVLTGAAVIADGALAIKDGKILDVGPSAEVRRRHQGLRVVDGAGYTAMPGLVNAHTHAAMGFFRGLGHGRDQMIETFLIPAETKLTAELLEPLSYSYLVAGLKSGVTCFGDHYYFIDGIGRALDKLGLRGVIGETIADLGGAFPGDGPFVRWRKALERWPHSARIRPLVAPHAADTVSEALLKELGAFAKTHDLPIHLHLSQSMGERARVSKRAGVSPVAYAERCGVLGARTLAVHLVSIDDEDAAILARRGATAGFCPASQIVYERLAPVKMLTDAGVPLALGTDCAASNDTSDLLAEMRIAALLMKDRGVAPQAASPEAVLTAATLNGARALGYDAEIGTLAAGKAADVVFLQNDIGTQPMERPVTNLVFSMSSRNVRHVMIDGRFVLLYGELTTASETDLTAAYLASVAEIKRRLGRRAGT